MRAASLALPLLGSGILCVLGACHGGIAVDDTDKGKDVHIAMNGNGMGDSVSLNLPGVQAKIALPRVGLGKHVDLYGIALAPGTQVSDIDVRGQDGGTGQDDGRVQLRFTNPMGPEALDDYYRAQADKAGYADVTVNGGRLTADKGHKRFTLAASPQGSGSAGTIIVSGRE